MITCQFCDRRAIYSVFHMPSNSRILLCTRCMKDESTLARFFT